MSTYRFTVGSIECIAVTDCISEMATRDLMANADAAMLADIAAAGLLPDVSTMSMTCLLINTDAGWLLVDAGNGTPDGRIIENMASIGIQPTDITRLVLSHGHGDHYRGFLNAAGEHVFAGIPIYIPCGEYEFYASDAGIAEIAKTEPDRAAELREYLVPYREQMVPVNEPDAEIVPGIRFLPLPGHTVQHTGIHIHSDGEDLFYLADTFLHPAMVAFPEVMFRLDSFPAVLEETRRDICARAIELNAKVLLYHFPFPGIGEMVEDEVGYRFRPMATEPIR